MVAVGSGARVGDNVSPSRAPGPREGRWTLPGGSVSSYRGGVTGNDPAVTTPSEGSDPGAAETPGPSGFDAVSDDDRAGAGMEIGRMLNTIDAQDEADPLPSGEHMTASLSPEYASLHTMREIAAQSDRAERRDHHRAYLIGILALLGGAAIAGALLFNSLGGENAAPASGGVDAPVAQPVPATDAAQPTPATDAVQPTPTPTLDPSRAPVVPDTWRFTGKWGLDVTMTLLPEGDGYGRIRVRGEPNAKGSYTWNGSTLKIAYKQPATLLTGNVVDTKGRFTCKGQPTSAKVRCTIRALGWTSTSTSQNSRWLRFTATGRPLQ